MAVPSELIPKCPRCSKPMTMNLRSDNAFVEDDGWHRAAERYDAFLRTHSGRILFLELGVGYNTPVIIKYPLPLYAAFRSSVLDNLPDTRIEAKKTQISFFNRHLFAAVSFTPVRKAKDRSGPFLTITFGLPYRKESPRIDAAVEPYPHRWTHHVMIGAAEEIDDELLSWIAEAAAFGGSK